MAAETKRTTQSGWRCERCTFVNDNGGVYATPICEMCRTARPSKWYCECGTWIFDRAKCSRCSNVNKDVEKTKLMRNGDGGWTCPEQTCLKENAWYASECTYCHRDNLEIEPLDPEILAVLQEMLQVNINKAEAKHRSNVNAANVKHRSGKQKRRNMDAACFTPAVKPLELHKKSTIEVKKPEVRERLLKTTRERPFAPWDYVPIAVFEGALLVLYTKETTLLLLYRPTENLLPVERIARDSSYDTRVLMKIVDMRKTMQASSMIIVGAHVDDMPHLETLFHNGVLPSEDGRWIPVHMECHHLLADSTPDDQMSSLIETIRNATATNHRGRS